ncbi:general transcription factor II-I repeat domain-containing protein 2 [Osmia lignaria lignaria]|uniref:general transcription factor II-I repeat domain-containing protein 2 n=1 Tax=Osmia lignaria lignaria TaxID=1437193 RepID=UPI001478855A|nr:general transcription factor II-I repeat domain-containing protein 2-like [Osmia lignaria]
MAEFHRKRSSVSTYFKPSWESDYFFIEQEGVPTCLICGKKLHQVKKYNLQRHFQSMHGHYAQLSGEEREAEVVQLKQKFVKAEVEEETVSSCSEAAVRASFGIALEIARSSRSYTDGDVVKKYLVNAAGQMYPTEVQAFEAISLSRTTIARRIQSMASNVMDQLRQLCSSFTAYSLAIDEGTDISGTPQIAIFIRGVNNNLYVTEELLDLVPLRDGVSEEDMFSCVEEIIENNQLDWHKLVSIATDGTPAMADNTNGLVGRLRKKLNELGNAKKLVAVHCLIHRQNLCTKNIEMSNVMSVIVRVTNYIRNHGLKRKQFRAFLEELDSEYADLPYYTEVRWLNRGKLLEQFYNLRSEIAAFMESMQNPVAELKDNDWLVDLAFLTDLVHHLNTLNQSLQRKGMLIVELYDTIQAFQMKIQLWMGQLQIGNSCHFPRLKAVATNQNCFTKYCSVLDLLEQEFNGRFKDVQSLNIEFNIFATPFSVNLDTVPPEMQLELIDMKCDRMLKNKFNQAESLAHFYTGFSHIRFPLLYTLAGKILCMFGSTYVCEQLFLNMKKTKSIHRTGLTNYNLKCSLLLSSCQSIVPDITFLMEQKRLQTSSRRLFTTE